MIQHPYFWLVLFSLACAAPKEEALVPVKAIEPSSLPTETTTKPAAVVAPPEKSEPEELPPLALPKIEDISPKLFMKGAVMASVAPGGKTMATFRYKEATLISPSGKTSFPGEFSSARFSPDLSMAVLIAWRSAYLVSMKDGALIQELKVEGEGHTELEAHFLSNEELLFFDGCQLQDINLKTETTSAISPKICGRAASNEDGTRWIFAETNAAIYTSRKAFGLYSFNLATKETTTILNNKTVSLISVAPTADRVCYSESTLTAHAPVGYLCWEQSGRTTKVWDGVISKGFGFSPDGSRAVFGAGNYNNPTSIYLIDFTTNTRQKIMDLPTRLEWIDMLSSARVVVTGGSGPALLIDLSKPSVQSPPPAEWEGFAPIPGDDSQAIMGRERGGTRDLYWLSWP